MSHSIVGMSVLERRLGCPGSAAAERGIPDRASPAASRGSSLHEAAAQALQTGASGAEVWQEDDDGVALIDEYLRVVRGVHQRLGGDLYIEYRFDLADLHPELFGTADAVVVAPPVVAVIDFKSGQGHRVDVTRKDGRPNLQLAGYGLGALSLLPDHAAVQALELHIVQPLNGGHTTTTLDPLGIADVAADILDIVEAALRADAPRHAGDWCRWCRAAFVCPALRDAALDAVQAEFDDVAENGFDCRLPEPTHMPPEDLARALGAAHVLDLWIAAVRQHAYAEAQHGRLPPGWKLVTRKGRRKWSGEADEAVIRNLLIHRYGMAEEAVFTRQPCTPTQAETRLKRLLGRVPSRDWSIIQQQIHDLTVTGNTGYALVPETDAREAIANGPEVEFESSPNPTQEPTT